MHSKAAHADACSLCARSIAHAFAGVFFLRRTRDAAHVDTRIPRNHYGVYRLLIFCTQFASGLDTFCVSVRFAKRAIECTGSVVYFVHSAERVEHISRMQVMLVQYLRKRLRKLCKLRCRSIFAYAGAA